MRHASMAAAALCFLATPVAMAQTADDLGRYFGFEPMRTIVVDDGCGPVAIGDFNDDGRPDLAIVNNRKSRIELHFLRAQPRTEAERERESKPNEIPPSPWYDRHELSVAHRIGAIAVHDVDADGMLDFVYSSSSPREIVVMRQTAPATFEEWTKRRVADVNSGGASLAIADVLGDAREEVISVVGDHLEVFPLSRDGQLGDPEKLGSSGGIVALMTEDYNGDGLTDVMGVVPEDASPIRLWLQRQDPAKRTKAGLLGTELRFEMPPLREAEPIRIPGRDGASIGVIERQSQRIVLYDLAMSDVAEGAGEGERDVQAAVTAFEDGSKKGRSVVAADLDADGREDLLATNAATNTIVWYRQSPGIGLAKQASFSAFKAPKSIGVGQWNGSGPPEVFVLSEEEKTVGVASFDETDKRLGFPQPIALQTTGATPVAMGYLTLDNMPTLGVVVQVDRRNHTLELVRPSDEGVTATTIALDAVKRAPDLLLGADADQDGRTDILLLAANEPMVLVRSTDDAMEVLTQETMRQFGLVQAAGPANTAMLDVDGDGKDELLIADDNFVRACAFDAEKGWRVIDQITVTDPGTKLASLTTLSLNGKRVVVAADSGNDRVLLMSETDGAWGVADRMHLLGFPPGRLIAGSFAGDDAPSIIALSDDAFGLVRLGGQRPVLDQFAAYRSDSDDRLDHDIEAGDLNSDGYVDLVVLDAGEQMCEIFTLSASRKLYKAVEFEVFESRLFSGGRARVFEPRSVKVTDATGDNKDDIIVTVHDRIIVYPQMTRPAN